MTSEDRRFMPPAPALPSTRGVISAEAVEAALEASRRAIADAAHTHDATPIDASGVVRAAPHAIAPSFPYVAMDPTVGAIHAVSEGTAWAHRAHVEALMAVERAFLELRARTSLGAILLAAPSYAIPGVAVPMGSAYSPSPELLGTPAMIAPTIEAERVQAAPGEDARPLAPTVPQTAASSPAPFSLSREQLEALPEGAMAAVLGPRFAHVLDYPQQIRLPRGPLLLPDRIAAIEGELGGMGAGVIRGEVEVREDAWYLDGTGHMLLSMVIEGLQLNMALTSYLGVDLLHEGDHVFRLVESQMRFVGPVPKIGDKVEYEFRIERPERMGTSSLFFSTSTTRVNGELQGYSARTVTGVFSPGDVASGSASPFVIEDGRTLEETFELPERITDRRSFSREDIEAFAAGDAHACFGENLPRLATHSRTPRIPSGQARLIDVVTKFDPTGGPWGRGHLVAEMSVAERRWFFDAHFPHDPCMPGCLMLEGCLQALEIHMTALGLTAGFDGFRFQPVLDRDVSFRARRAITPSSEKVTFDVFVESVRLGPTPQIIADLVCSADGQPAFYSRRFALELTPDWPLDDWRRNPWQVPGAFGPLPALGGLAGWVPHGPSHKRRDGREFDYPAILASAWGRVTDLRGPGFEALDGPLRVPRLPGPPFLFMTRVLEIEGTEGVLVAGSATTGEYLANPSGGWYYGSRSGDVMPFPVLLEAVLQPCGFASAYFGPPPGEDLYYRNLDGYGTVHGEVRPGDALVSRVELTSASQMGETTLFDFRIVSWVGDRKVFEVDALFGQFPKDALASQAGIVTTPEQRARIVKPTEQVIELASRPAKYFAGSPALPDTPLLMLDRITAWEPCGGRAGLGWVRGELDVDPRAWFFKVHFFRDPVQPGSLGLEAFCQLLQLAMIERGIGRDIPGARFESIAVGRPLRWKYRGQVLPEAKQVITEVEIVEIGEDDRGPYAVADALLWVDGTCVYSAHGLAMRVVPGGPIDARPSREIVVDPKIDAWLADHAPNWTVPSIPMLGIADLLAAEAAARHGRTVRSITDVQVRRFLVTPGPTRLKVELADVEGDAVRATLLAWREAKTASLSRFDPVASATIHFALEETKVDLLPPFDGEPLPDPYEHGTIFHGPTWQVVTSAKGGLGGASGQLDPARGRAVPARALPVVLLDAVFHVIRGDEAWRTWAGAPKYRAGLPARIERLRLFRPLDPHARDVRIEGRAGAVKGDFADLYAQLVADGEVIADLDVVVALLPTAFGDATSRMKRDFIRDHKPVRGLSLSEVWETWAELDEATLKRFDWIPGGAAMAYGVPVEDRDDLLAQIVVRDLVASQAHCHPSEVVITSAESPDLVQATTTLDPNTHHPVAITRAPATVRAELAGPPRNRPRSST